MFSETGFGVNARVMGCARMFLEERWHKLLIFGSDLNNEQKWKQTEYLEYSDAVVQVGNDSW